jgi:hypothetical protein
MLVGELCAGPARGGGIGDMLVPEGRSPGSGIGSMPVPEDPAEAAVLLHTIGVVAAGANTIRGAGAAAIFSPCLAFSRTAGVSAERNRGRGRFRGSPRVL